MEDHKLKVFCTVAETKSFSKTSEIIHLTQPAVSLQIQALEEKYETKLFDRSSSTVTLTPAGETLYKYAKEILTLYTSAERAIGKQTGLVKGSLSIGAGSNIGNFILPTLITEFMRIHPKIKIYLLVNNSKRVIELLNAGNIDLGLVEGDVSRQKMIVKKLLSDELLLIVSPEHHWAKKKEVSISELAKEPFILREPGSGTRQMIEKFLARHDITLHDLKISAILGSTEAIKDAVENGLGISIISRWAVRKENRYGTLHLLSIKEEKMVRDFSLIMKKNSVSSNSLEEFVSFLKAYPYDKLLG
ncbi:MAG TPA: selenium metabolism-associated LysR family transcriptional regulator, partial [Thermodesulfovibrionales bacterium]|jgi:DNA-binding transcriptional LysR family regulator|nr:selenium metabolism-associated LysR family transcriptional regulator [Thermodesulfovibrionales bacterium]